MTDDTFNCICAYVLIGMLACMWGGAALIVILR